MEKEMKYATKVAILSLFLRVNPPMGLKKAV